MNRRTSVRIGVVLLAAVVVMVVSLANRPAKDGEAVAGAAPVVKKESQRPAVGADGVVPVAPDGGGAVAPAKKATDAEILVEIEEAAVTYDAKSLPVINRYLLHSSPEVRRAARDGMIVLGSSEAAPLLLNASRQTADVKEARELMEAAEYLQLPAGKLTRRSKKEGGGLAPAVER